MMKQLPLLLAFALGACATVGGAIPHADWQAADVNGAPLVPGSSLTLRLDGGRASGSAGCNTYFGNYELSAREGLRFSGLGSTRMACPEPLMEQERRYLNILENASGYSLYRDGSLAVIAADGRVIRFTPR